MSTFTGLARPELPAWQAGEYPLYAVTVRDVERRHGIPTRLLARLLDYAPEVIAGVNRSPQGAIGIAQLPANVPPLFGYGPEVRTNPHLSISIAALYFKKLYRDFGSWRRAVIAYRWSPEVCDKLSKRAGEVSPEVPEMIARDLDKISADVRIPT